MSTRMTLFVNIHKRLFNEIRMSSHTDSIHDPNYSNAISPIFNIILDLLIIEFVCVNYLFLLISILYRKDQIELNMWLNMCVCVVIVESLVEIHYA